MVEGEITLREMTGDQRDLDIPTVPDLEIPVIPKDSDEIAVREGIQERTLAEIQHQDKEAEAVVEEMLEVPPQWNEVPDLMMEEENVQPATETASKQKIDEVARDAENGRKMRISGWRNVNTCPQCHHAQGIQRDFILKIGMKLYRKKMNGNRQIKDKGLHRLCFVADVRLEFNPVEY